MSQIERLYNIYINCNQKICIDSRLAEIKNAVFFAIRGDNFNGNDFIEDAFSKGAKYAISDDIGLAKQKDSNIILVKNTLETLQNLATYHRKSLNIPIITITGSNGKTTTKEILTHILKSTFNPLSTSGNFNNHIGVPLTLLSINKQHDIAVIEMGANHVGEIKELCEIAQPTHGIITNIGDAHLEGFGSLENIKIAKNELFEYLKENNKTIVYNAEDKILTELVNDYANTRSYKNPYWTSTASFPPDYRYVTKPFIEIKNINLKSFMKHGVGDIHTKLIGKHNINNISAAIEIAEIFNISPVSIRQRLEQFELTNNRCEFIETKKNKILLDAYNANPTSMSSGILNFKDWNNCNRLLGDHYGYRSSNMLFILGDMLELGENEVQYHQEIIDLLAEEIGPLPKVILVGNIFSETRTSKLKHREDLIEFSYCSKVKSNVEAAKIIKKENFSNMSIFIKGSRNLQLEKLIDYL